MSPDVSIYACKFPLNGLSCGGLYVSWNRNLGATFQAVRLGCLGCLAVLVAVPAIIVAAAGLLLLSSNISQTPDNVPTSRYARGEGLAAQQKLYEVLRRQAGRSTSAAPIVITEREANAFLTQHLDESASLPFDPLAVRFTRGHVDILGRTVLKHLLRSGPMSHALPYIPRSRLEEPIWVTVRGRLQIEPAPDRSSRGKGELVVTDLTLGKQPVGAWLIWAFLGRTATSNLLRWSLPGAVSDVQAEDGRLIINTR